MEQLGNVPESNLEKKSVIDGIEYVFAQHPEIASIGTQEQYSDYVESIFPETEIKEIVWHGTNNEFAAFNEEKIGSAMDVGTAGRGIYFTEDRGKYGVTKLTLPVVLNVKNPYYDLESNIYDFGDRVAENGRWTDSIMLNTSPMLDPENPFVKIVLEKLGDRKEISGSELAAIFSEAMKELGFDGTKHYSRTFNDEEIVVFSSDQTHILGSNQDIEKFKEFVSK